jgi:hypothetical protein
MVLAQVEAVPQWVVVQWWGVAIQASGWAVQVSAALALGWAVRESE